MIYGEDSPVLQRLRCAHTPRQVQASQALRRLANTREARLLYAVMRVSSAAALRRRVHALCCCCYRGSDRKMSFTYTVDGSIRYSTRALNCYAARYHVTLLLQRCIVVAIVGLLSPARDTRFTARRHNGRERCRQAPLRRCESGEQASRDKRIATTAYWQQSWRLPLLLLWRARGEHATKGADTRVESVTPYTTPIRR